MVAVKQQKHLSMSFAIETKTYYSRILTSNISSSARTVQLAKSCFFDLRKIPLGQSI